jgi:hypothetical protein
MSYQEAKAAYWAALTEFAGLVKQSRGAAVEVAPGECEPSPDMQARQQAVLDRIDQIVQAYPGLQDEGREYV